MSLHIPIQQHDYILISTHTVFNTEFVQCHVPETTETDLLYVKVSFLFRLSMMYQLRHRWKLVSLRPLFDVIESCSMTLFSYVRVYKLCIIFIYVYLTCILVEGWIKSNNSACINHVAQGSDTAQVTR